MEHSMPSIDRLSCLPDEIICHILTFFPTKLSVRTSVLSKRWRFLWAHVPSLEFNFDDRDRPVNSEIINEIVLNHKCDIHTFHLRGDFDGSREEFESLIVNIITHNIRNVVLDLEDYEFELPQCLFTCKTMVVFWLCRFDDYIPESGIYLPALRKIKIRSYSSQSHESLAHLLSGCSLLEEFSFKGVMLGRFCVSSSILTRLVLQIENYDISEFGLKLDTPALRYLKLRCLVPGEFSVGSLDSLIEAKITLNWHEWRQDNLLYSRNVLALVGKLHNVRILSLWTDRVSMIHVSTFFALGIKFHNLTKLDMSINLGFITSFLGNANNLQVLGLVIHDKDYWVEPKRVPTCLSSHLQTVQVESFKCYEKEFDIIRYILRNAKVLKRMEIHTCVLHRLDLKKKHVALKRLASFGRGSQECELVFD